MANSGIGWFGPQIDLSDAPSHVGDFVQLLVFVHRSVPLQVSISLSLFVSLLQFLRNPSLLFI